MTAVDSSRLTISTSATSEEKIFVSNPEEIFFGKYLSFQ
jgi:hypothetical protein